MPIRDPFVAGIAGGWRVVDAALLNADLRLDADVVIVGTGAGGGTAAEILAHAGLQIVMIEEGPLKTPGTFRMLEADAYPALYQESAARKTKDKGINILQGRCVGGSTTVNWTSSFRTPRETLRYWREAFGLKEFTTEALDPWFAMMERRLNIHPWLVTPNQNNDVFRRGAAKLGIATAPMQRNVKDCFNLGYCGTGCPTNAKQSMLITTIPAALSRGARLVANCRAERLVADGNKISALECRALDASGLKPSGYKIAVTARAYVLAAGAIGSPALLMRSRAPDPYRRVGKRTFLHPTCLSAAVMAHKVEAYSGAPQSVFSDHFLDRQPLNGPIGYKLEVPPLHPLLTAITLQGFGEEHARLMEQMAFTQAMLALLRDGFHPESEGGTVSLKGDGTPVLDYPISEFVWDGMRRAYLSMAEIQFAAGAREVLPVHEDAIPYNNWTTAREAIGRLSMRILKARVVSAHAMGGCGMGSDGRHAVVNAEGRHHHLDNVFVFDGSVFPTSVGANPQLSIYALSARQATRLAAGLTGRAAS
jgi:choline dehydrogenase-like flavoprotein